MRRLDGASAFMLYAETPRVYQHTLKIAIFDPPDDSGRFRDPEYIQSNFSSLPYLKWKIASAPFGINHPYWVEDLDFNLANHVTHIACPQPGDRGAFCKLVSDLYVQPLDRSRPLWKLWIIEGLEGGQVAYVSMLHHAYTDGVGFSQVLEALITPGKFPSKTSEDFGVNSRRNPGKLWMFADSLTNLPVLILGALPRLMSNTMKMRKIQKSFKNSGKTLPPDPSSAPDSPLNTVLGHGRTFYYDHFDLKEFKALSKACGATVNELLLAVVTGALRRYYQALGEPLTEALVATIPVSQRPEEKKAEILGNNYVSSSSVSIPINVDDPVERLSLIKQSSQAMKEYVKATKGLSFLDAISIMPPAVSSLLDWFVRKSEGKFGFTGNLAVSNVPGPTEPIRLDQQHTVVSDLLSIGQVTYNLGLNITAWRYVDRLNVCIMADAKVVPDGQLFMSYIAEAYQECKSNLYSR